MKKTYIEPTTMIMAVEVKSSLLGASDPQTQTLSVDGETISSDTQIGSRRSSLWDDEEEE